MRVEIIHGRQYARVIQRRQVLDVAIQFAGQVPVYAVETDLGDHGRQATVHERQPGAVLAVRFELPAVCEEAGGKPLVELPTDLVAYVAARTLRLCVF